jgi:hypothetical protein
MLKMFMSIRRQDVTNAIKGEMRVEKDKNPKATYCSTSPDLLKRWSQFHDVLYKTNTQL